MSEMNIDTRALTEPLRPEAVAAYRRRPEAVNAGRMGVAGWIGTVFAIGLIIASGVVFFALLPLHSEHAAVLALLIPLILVGGITAVFLAMRRRMWQRQTRLAGFAEANGMSFTPLVSSPPLPGMLFGIGSARKSTDVLRGATPRFVEFADYQFTTGSGKQQQTHRWRYVAIRMHNVLPNIVLDATANNAFISNLPRHFDKSQRLSLEGDFDQRFQLYCPSGYETDALYLFTPDVMVNFMDTAGDFDVEIVDDWIFLYSQSRPSTLLPATWAWQFRAVQALLTKISQWERWRDDRLAESTAAMSTPGAPMAFAGAAGHAAGTGQPQMLPPLPSDRPRGVAAPGRRLRGARWPWLTVVIALVAWFLISFLPQILGR